MRDLAPVILRQRLIIEGYPARPITAQAIVTYLTELSAVLTMDLLLRPVTHRSERYGEAGWVHWEASGAHFYAWEKPVLFFSVDIYTCKAFVEEDAVAFTRQFFAATDIESESF